MRIQFSPQGKQVDTNEQFYMMWSHFDVHKFTRNVQVFQKIRYQQKLLAKLLGRLLAKRTTSQSKKHSSAITPGNLLYSFKEPLEHFQEKYFINSSQQKQFSFTENRDVPRSSEASTFEETQQFLLIVIN